MAKANLYPVRLGWRLLFCASAVVFLVLGAFLVFHVTPAFGSKSLATDIFLLLLAFGFAAGGFAVFLVALRWRLEQSSTHLGYRYFLKTRSVLLTDIVGWRFTGSSPAILVLKLKSRQPQLEIAMVFDLDDSFWDSLQDARDLDWEDALRAADRIASDRSLGASPDENFDNLERSQKEARWINSFSFALSLWAIFWPLPYWPLMAALMLMPFAVLLYVRIKAGLVSLDGTEKDLIPNVAVAWILPVSALLLRRVLDLNHVSDAWEIGTACAVFAMAFCALAIWADGKTRGSKFAILLIALFGAAYGAGAAPILNRLLSDEVPDSVIEERVLSKHVSTGKVMTYTVELERSGSLTISRDLFDRITISQTLCSGIYSGALGLKRVRVGTCPLTPEP
jgi:hypothetical protein